MAFSSSIGKIWFLAESDASDEPICVDFVESSTEKILFVDSRSGVADR